MIAGGYWTALGLDCMNGNSFIEFVDSSSLLPCATDPNNRKIFLQESITTLRARIIGGTFIIDFFYYLLIFHLFQDFWRPPRSFWPLPINFSKTKIFSPEINWFFRLKWLFSSIFWHFVRPPVYFDPTLLFFFKSG